jgi:hypothetical protein
MKLRPSPKYCNKLTAPKDFFCALAVARELPRHVSHYVFIVAAFGFVKVIVFEVFIGEWLELALFLACRFLKLIFAMQNLLLDLNVIFDGEFLSNIRKNIF